MIDPVPTVPLQHAWPSLLFSGVSIVLWLDYLLGGLKAYTKRRTRSIWREIVVAFVMLLSAIALGYGIVIAWTPPPLYIDIPLVLTLTALRTIMLIVGLWLAWDRRKAP